MFSNCEPQTLPQCCVEDDQADCVFDIFGEEETLIILRTREDEEVVPRAALFPAASGGALDEGNTLTSVDLAFLSDAGVKCIDYSEGPVGLMHDRRAPLVSTGFEDCRKELGVETGCSRSDLTKGVWQDSQATCKTVMHDQEELQMPLQADSGSAGETQISKSLPWLKLGGESHLEIVPDANDILIKERGYINMMMVCGNVRTGKSYLLNALLDQQVFGVSDQATSFTSGAEICSHLLPISHFGGHVSSKTPKIAVVDMEGQGDKGIKQDAKVATPLLMMSKAVILNEVCPVGPAKDVILEKLEVMMYASQCVQIRRDRRQIFGCLHIILRDCPQSEQECYHIIFDKEDVNVADTDEHAEAIQKRNYTRSAIALAFESSRVWCLPKIMATVAPPRYRDAGDAYADKVDALRLELAAQLAVPKMVNGCKLTGSMIGTLLPQVADEVKKDNPALTPSSLMDRFIYAEANIFADELMQSARSELTSLRKRLPMDPEELLQEANAIKSRIIKCTLLMASEEPELHHQPADKRKWPTGQMACTSIVEQFEEKFNAEMAQLTSQNGKQILLMLREIEQELHPKFQTNSEQVKSPKG